MVAHKFFDNLRNVDISKFSSYLNGEILPLEMFQFTNEEISLNVNLIDTLLTEELLILYHEKTPPPEFVEEIVEEIPPEPEKEEEPVQDINYDEFNFEDDNNSGDIDT